MTTGSWWEHGTDSREGTHYIGCWRIHHDCAVALLERIVDGAIEVYHDEQGYPRIRRNDGGGNDA